MYKLLGYSKQRSSKNHEDKRTPIIKKKQSMILLSHKAVIPIYKLRKAKYKSRNQAGATLLQARVLITRTN